MVLTKYKCIHCGKFRGSHSANGLFCPINGRKNSFSPFSKTDTYTPDMSKPIKYTGFTL
jgi:hypothetical protein